MQPLSSLVLWPPSVFPPNNKFNNKIAAPAHFIIPNQHPARHSITTTITTSLTGQK